jgi:hypothetical protein
VTLAPGGDAEEMAESVVGHSLGGPDCSRRRSSRRPAQEGQTGLARG